MAAAKSNPINFNCNLMLGKQLVQVRHVFWARNLNNAPKITREDVSSVFKPLAI